MSVTATAVDTTGYTKSWDVEATADGDTTATIAHGFGATPGLITLRPLKAEFYVSTWTVAVDGTNITLTKGTGAGSGASGAQVRVQAQLPHSIAA